MDKKEQDEKYAQDIDKMLAAGGVWMRSHPFAEPRFRFTQFEQEVAEQANRRGQNAAIVAVLSDVIDRVGANEDGKALLRAMDAAVDGRATYLQAKGIIDYQIERALERRRGEFAKTGDWRCPCCQTVLEHFTFATAVEKQPAPGDYSLCASCGAFARVNAEGNAFDPVTISEIEALPAKARKEFLSLREILMHKKTEYEARKKTQV